MACRQTGDKPLHEPIMTHSLTSYDVAVNLLRTIHPENLAHSSPFALLYREALGSTMRNIGKYISHQRKLMMTSSNGNFFRVTGPLCGEFIGHRWIPSQRPVTRSFDVFFDLRLNKRLNKQSRRRWFEAPSCSLWRHCNVRVGPQRTKYIKSPYFPGYTL